MTDETLKNLIKHPFEVQAAQAAVDKVSMEKEGFFTPDIYFADDHNGFRNARELNRYIKKMGYQSEIADDSIDLYGRGQCLHLKVGKIPQTFLDDIKDYMELRERERSKPNFALRMDENGHHKHTNETAMMAAFEKLGKSQKRKDSGGGGVIRGLNIT